jgi:hypothetical protein
MTDLVLESLERVAERVDDITPLVYEKYFARCADSRSLMLYVDDLVRGRMLQEVLRLLMTEDIAGDGDYLRFETRTHAGYGVKPAMYGELLGAVRDTVREVLDADWNVDFAAAWERRVGALLAAIDAAAPLAADPG